MKKRKRRLKSAIKFSDMTVDYKSGDLVKHKDDGAIGIVASVVQPLPHLHRDIFVYFNDGMFELIPESYLEKVFNHE